MVNLRPLLLDDAAALAALHKAAFLRPWSYEDFMLMLNESYRYGLAAFEEDKIISFVLFQSILGEAEILTIATHPDYKRRGLAKKLVATMIDDLITGDIEKIWLEVAESNKAAQALYHQFGFVTINKRPDYYETEGGREDALVLAKILPRGAALAAEDAAFDGNDDSSIASNL